MTTSEITPSSNNATAPLPAIYVSLGAHRYILPYIQRSCKGVFDVVTDLDDALFYNNIPVAAVMVSSTEIYNRTEGEMLAESEPIDQLSDSARAELNFSNAVDKAGIPSAIIRCPWIVATGMKGLPRRIANLCYRGICFYITGNEAKISVVHGIDIAKAIFILAKNLAAGNSLPLNPNGAKVYNCTPPDNPSVEQFCSAIAKRVNRRMPSNLAPKWSKLLYGKSLYSLLTTTLTFDGSLLRSIPGIDPMTDVCEYLTNHVYDHESL